ncbi:MAG: DUF2029 domain-containing protein [Candidatus Levybacteria bacterium]|nr:DUF2029 domain-containing protein [Candidatus Levybacteria bacterium]
MAKKITIFIFLVGVLSLLRTTFLLWNSSLPDFNLFYQSAGALLSNQNPYKNPLLFTQILYPPLVILMFIPFLGLSLALSSKIWMIMSIISAILSILVLRLIKPLSTSIILIIFSFLVLSFPFKFTLGMGQINLILLLLLSLFIYFLHFEKKVFSGLILSIAIYLKLFPGMFLILLAIKKKWAVITSLIIFTILLFIPSLLFIDFEIYSYYLKSVLLPFFINSSGDPYYNQSITGFLARFDIPKAIMILPIMFILIISTYLIIKKTDLIRSFTLLMVVVLLVKSYTMQHHLVLLLIPYYFLISETKSVLTLSFIGISYLLVAFNIKNPEAFANALFGPIILSHGFLGMLLLWIIMVKKNWNKIR